MTQGLYIGHVEAKQSEAVLTLPNAAMTDASAATIAKIVRVDRIRVLLDTTVLSTTGVCSSGSVFDSITPIRVGPRSSGAALAAETCGEKCGFQ
jgi:hypothetical protein